MGAVLARRVLVLFVAAVMAMVMSMGPALAFTGGGGAGGAPNGGAGGGFGSGGNNKVTICHSGHTLYVTKKQARWHLNHHWRDYWGPCKKKTDHHHKGYGHNKNSWHR